MIQPLLSLRNFIDFPLRQGIRWRRPLHSIKNESKEDLFADLPLTEREAVEKREIELRDHYRLQKLHRSSTRQNYRENLYYLELLARCWEEASLNLPMSPNVADIGVSHWFYVQAFYNFLTWQGGDNVRSVNLAGFEVDPYRVYSDLRSRYDHALAHIGDLPGTHYIPQGFQRKPEAYDLITMFFPFVFQPDHLRWGLPAKMFAPRQMLSDAWDSLKPGGVLLIVNQGLKEHEAQREMLGAITSSPPISFKHESPFFLYDLPRYVLVSVKAS
ncbi:MAG: hypothetical protein DWQ07_05050 [Chloroflexi bacterium]|nr:MAG: hypothetical protein DWQ07_05050 [Chloroflexota bacterium]MBL1194800.1 hypothetical protein [Chloroflexota bacterium]NOH12092.1 hypothetical protein [Chloroflexota bacterium]